MIPADGKTGGGHAPAAGQQLGDRAGPTEDTVRTQLHSCVRQGWGSCCAMCLWTQAPSLAFIILEDGFPLCSCEVTINFCASPHPDSKDGGAEDIP